VTLLDGTIVSERANARGAPGDEGDSA